MPMAINSSELVAASKSTEVGTRPPVGRARWTSNPAAATAAGTAAIDITYLLVAGKLVAISPAEEPIASKLAVIDTAAKVIAKPAADIITTEEEHSNSTEVGSRAPVDTAIAMEAVGSTTVVSANSLPEVSKSVSEETTGRTVT